MTKDSQSRLKENSKKREKSEAIEWKSIYSERRMTLQCNKASTIAAWIIGSWLSRATCTQRPLCLETNCFFHHRSITFYYLDRKFKRTMHVLRLISSNSKLNQQTTRSSQRKKSNHRSTVERARTP